MLDIGELAQTFGKTWLQLPYCREASLSGCQKLAQRVPVATRLPGVSMILEKWGPHPKLRGHGPGPIFISGHGDSSLGHSPFPSLREPSRGGWRSHGPSLANVWFFEGSQEAFASKSFGQTKRGYGGMRREHGGIPTWRHGP